MVSHYRTSLSRFSFPCSQIVLHKVKPVVLLFLLDFVIPFTKEVMFSPLSICLLMGWLVCVQDYAKLHDGFPQTLVKGWDMRAKREPNTFWQGSGGYRIFHLIFFNIVRLFFNISQRITHGS